MIKSSTPPMDEKSEVRRRLHLRDISSDAPLPVDTVGAELRAARLKRGEDLRSIAAALRIRREQLEALEEGRHRDLPGRAYAIGFVRSYAEYLGLDVAHVVDRYKFEIDQSERAMDAFTFPKVTEETRLPRGTFLIVGLVVALGIYGGWLLTRSADKMMAERVPPVPERIEERAGSTGAPDERPVLSGDPASAATRTQGSSSSSQLLGVSAPQQDSSAVYAVPPAPAAAPVAADAVPATAPAQQVAALEPQPAAAPVQLQAELAPALPPIQAGQTFGSENIDGRVVVRARKSDAWIRVEDAQGHVLIERTLALGDSYRAPGKPGIILVARDASAFEILVDGTSLGLAGPPTLVLTGKPLDAAALIAASPQQSAAAAPAGQPGAPAAPVAR
ncbi:RodZ domain-containing protein [Parvibaculum sp.]|uniref:helix-turn-helix domain-containing protein n=1 Tax=Parvibaculum sp. TaxID=2024848 RepID=UPI00320D17E6